jgi:NADPH2:quinone reductase
VRAWQLTSLDGPDGLELVEVPEPEPSHFASPGSGVVIDVHAAGIAFPDVLMTRGGYQDQPALPFIPGIEVAGVVAAASADADLEVGQRVAAYTQIGALAERAVAPVVSTFPLPDELDFVAGAGLIVNYHTAYFGLRTRAGLQAGENVLIHGAAGGLGSAAVQVVSGLGASSIAVVSSDEKVAFARRAGADEVVRVDGPWPLEVRELVGDGGVDLAFDPVGGDRATESLRLLREGGRLLIVGFTSGVIPEVKLNRLVLRNLSVVGAGYGAYIAARPSEAARTGEAVGELVRAGNVRPLIGHRFAFEEADQAFRLIDRREGLGKVVVEVRRPGVAESPESR